MLVEIPLAGCPVMRAFFSLSVRLIGHTFGWVDGAAALRLKSET